MGKMSCCCPRRSMCCANKLFFPPRRSHDLTQTCSHICIVASLLLIACTTALTILLFRNATLSSSFLPPWLLKNHRAHVTFDIIVIATLSAITCGCIGCAIYFTWESCFCCVYNEALFSDDEDDYRRGVLVQEDAPSVCHVCC